MVLAIESYGGAIVTYPWFSKEELAVPANLIDAEKQATDESAKRKYLRVMMLCKVDRGIYGKLVEELQNNFTKGNNE